MLEFKEEKKGVPVGGRYYQRIGYEDGLEINTPIVVCGGWVIPRY